MNIIVNALKSICIDLIKSIRHHFFKFIGIITIWVIPLVLLFSEGYIGKVNKNTFRLWTIPVFIILLLLYWVKLRHTIKENLKMEKFANRFGKQASNAALYFIYSLLDLLMSTLTIFIIYQSVLIIEQFTLKVSTFLAVVTLTTLIGKFFYLIDTIVNIGRNYNLNSLEENN